MKKKVTAKDWLVVALATVAVVGVSLFAKTKQVAFAQEASEEGRIVQIGPTGDFTSDLPTVAPQDEAEAPPTYWIGVGGRPVESPVLRTQLQLASDLGVVIENIVPDGPADKAGLRKHDVVIGVNGEPASDMIALQRAVVGGEGAPVELKVIRLGKETSVTIAPEQPPEDFAQRAGRTGGMQFRFGGPGGQMGGMQQLLEQLQQGGMRNIGPGMVLPNQQLGGAGLPGGISVSISRDSDGPAKITVKKDAKTWTVEGDDEEAIAELPEDVQPFVRRMLQQSAGGPNAAEMMERFKLGGDGAGFDDFEHLVPDRLGGFGERLQRRRESLREGAEGAGEQMLDRMQKLEQRLEQLQRRLSEEPAESE